MFAVNDKCNEDRICMEIQDNRGRKYTFAQIVSYLNLFHATQTQDKIIKGQQLEINRLHNLADNMSGVLRSLGIYDVYDKEAITNVREKLK